MYSRIKKVSNTKTKAGTTISNKVKETKNKLSFNLQKPSYIPTQSRVTEVTASGAIPLSAFVEPEVTFVSTFNSHPEKVRNLLWELDSYSTIETSGTLTRVIWTTVRGIARGRPRQLRRSLTPIPYQRDTTIQIES